MLLEPLTDAYDVVLIDCAPGITLTSESVFATAHALVVPVVPSALSHRTLEQLDDFLRDRPDPPLVLPFASMVDRRKTLHRQHVARLAEAVPEFLPTVIADTAVVERMGSQRGPVAAYAPRAAVAIAYRRLWADIAARVWP